MTSNLPACVPLRHARWCLLERGGELEEAAVPDVAVIGAGAVRIAEDARLGPEDVSATMGSRTDFGREDGTWMLYDRLAGRELEHELISGAITRRGGRHACRHPPTKPSTRCSGRCARKGLLAERVGEPVGPAANARALADAERVP